MVVAVAAVVTATATFSPRPEPWTDPDDPQLDEALRRILDPHDGPNLPSPDRKVEVTTEAGLRHAVVTREDGTQFPVTVEGPHPGRRAGRPTSTPSVQRVLAARRRQRNSYRKKSA